MPPTNTPSNNELDELIEKLADIEHQRWSDWQKWCHKILRENCPSPELEAVLERWDRQIATPYSELSEAEKQSDRDQVARYLSLIQDWANKKVIEFAEKIKNDPVLKSNGITQENNTLCKTIDRELEALRKKG